MANHTILLIDYEPRSIERFRDPLVAAGYAVELATDGISGVEAFHRLNPDMVLVEAMIPKKHGFEVCQELKRTPHGRRTPVIITTGVYKGRKYRTQALHIYGCDEYIEKPIAPAQLLEIVGRFLAPGTQTPSIEATAPRPVSSASGDRPIARENVDAIATPAPSVVKDDREDEITARLDALLSGKGSESPQFAAPEKNVAAAAVAQDPFSQMRAELDAELGAISSPLAFETAPTLEPIVEPLVSDQMEAPSVLETLSVPAMEPPLALEPSPEMPAAPAGSDEQPGQLVNFETKRRRKGKKADKQVAKSAPKIEEVAEIAPIPEIVESVQAVIPVESVAPAAVNAPIQFPEITLPRGTMVESELEATPKRRGMPVWAWAAVAIVAVVGIYFAFPHGSSSPAPSPKPLTKAVASTPALATPPPVTTAPPVATPAPAATAPPATSAPSATLPKAPEPSRAVPESQKPVVIAAKVPVPKKRSDPVPAPAAAAPSSPETTVAGVETAPDPAATPAVTTIAPGSLVPIGLADTMPVSLKHKAPVYSAAAKQLGLSGTVTMNVLINDRGTVEQVVLVSGIPGADLNDAAMAAAKGWTYRPATKDGVPVKVWRSEQVVFKP